MKTVNDQLEDCTRVVSDAAEVDRLRWFQLIRYFECGLLPELPTELPDDPYLPHSTYFGVYAGDTILATARIVKPPDELPMLAFHDLNSSSSDSIQARGGHTAEISRLAVARDTPHFAAISLLCREFVFHALRHRDQALLLASVEKPFVRVINRVLGMPVEIVGPPIEQYGLYKGATIPVLIDTVRCLEIARRQDRERWEYFTNGLVIDVTNEAV